MKILKILGWMIVGAILAVVGLFGWQINARLTNAERNIVVISQFLQRQVRNEAPKAKPASDIKR